MTKTIREEFDREREFVVLKPLTLFGKNLTRGQPFDKTQVTTRRLRQLFDQYMVGLANGVTHKLVPQEPEPDKPTQSSPESFTEEEIEVKLSTPVEPELPKSKITRVQRKSGFE